MKHTINLTQWYEAPETIRKYIKTAPKTDIINWFDLPDNTQFLLRKFPEGIKKRSNSNVLSSLRLKKFCGNNPKLNDLIIGIKKMVSKNNFLRIQFPVNLNSKDYAKLYSLMVSEGSCNTEFCLHVPEIQFHDIFKETINSLLSEDFSDEIRISENKGFKRSRAPAKTRHLIPTPNHIPQLILKNKEFAREYLKVAFDAEGSPIHNENQHKRYIKLTRYVDITEFVEENLPLQKRIYKNKIIEEHPRLFNKIKYHPPATLLGEFILLKKHFNIDSQLGLEAIKKNKTSLRAGKITARWVLFIYAENVKKFINEISFISNEKRIKCKEMLKFRTNKPQYSALKLMKKLSKNNIFSSKDFVSTMKKKGYISPFKYIWEYKRKGLIEKVERGKYKLLVN